MSDDPWAAFRVRQQVSDPWAAFREPAPAESATATAAPQRSALGNLGLGVRATAEGLAAVPGLLYDAAAAPFNAAGSALGFGQVIPPAAQRVTQAADAIGLPTPETQRERTRSAVISGAASAVPTLAAGNALAAIPGIAGSIGRALASQPGVQTASAALAGGVAEQTGSPLAGAAAGIAAPLALNAGAAAVRGIASPAGQIDPERARMAAAAAREGIPLSAGQVTGSRPTQFIESAFDSLPITAGRAQSQTVAQQEAFNRAVLSRAGVSASRATPEVLTQTQKRLGAEYETLAARNNMGRTPEWSKAMDEIATSIETMTDDAAKAVKGYLKQIVERVNPQGVLPGKAWQNLDSRIGEQARESSTPEVRNALYQLQNALRDGMGASIRASGNSADWERWTDLRGRYSAFITVRDVMGRAGESIGEGHISPLALRAELAGNNAYAMGRGDLAQLARIGQTMLRPTPTSGTAERTAAMNLIQGGVGASSAGLLATGLAMGDPITAAAAAVPIALPPLAQRLYNAPLMQAYLRNQSLANMPNPVSGDTVRAIGAGQAAQVQRSRSGEPR